MECYSLSGEKDIKEKDRYLEGFNWRIEERPNQWKDIFLHPEALPTDANKEKIDSFAPETNISE